ncbi:hypothetical protein WDU94_007372 [Cyamophila willieti]
MFRNHRVVLSIKCFLIVLIVSPLVVCANSEGTNSSLVKVLKSTLPTASVSENTDNFMAFNPVIHDQLGTIFKQNFESRDNNGESSINTSKENTNNQDGRVNNNFQGKNPNEQERERVKNARIKDYGASKEDMELDNLISTSKKETPKTEKTDSDEELHGEHVPKEGNKRRLSNQTIEKSEKDSDQRLFDKGRAEIDEKADEYDFEKESQNIRQTKVNSIRLELVKDKEDPNKSVRQENPPNRQSKAANDAELGLAKSAEHDDDEPEPCSEPDSPKLQCFTNYSLSVSKRSIEKWEFKCIYIYMYMKDEDAEIVVTLKNAPDNRFVLELKTPKSDYKTEVKEDSLVPFCAPNEDYHSVCLYFDDSIIRQPKLVALHPYITLGDRLDKIIPLGRFYLCLDEDLKKKHLHHDFERHNHDHHHFGKLEMASKYDERKPVVQYWNPSESGGDSLGHHHQHNDDTHYSSSQQSNVYHHGNPPLFTFGNHGNNLLYTSGNLGNGYDRNLDSNAAQKYHGYHRNDFPSNRDNAFDKNYRGNSAALSSIRIHGNDINNYDNHDNHRHGNVPLYSPGYRNVNTYDSRSHGNHVHSSSGIHSNDVSSSIHSNDLSSSNHGNDINNYFVNQDTTEDSPNHKSKGINLKSSRINPYKDLIDNNDNGWEPIVA